MKRNPTLYQYSIFLLSAVQGVASIRAIRLTLFLLVGSICFSQSQLNKFLTPSDSLNLKRRNTVFITEGVVLTGTLIGLNQLWYADYPKSNFHTVDDNSQWLQLDKIGHFYSTYHVGRAGAELLAWSGASKKEQLLFGSTLGFGFLTVVEVFDGYSQEWGFSWGDMLANASGTGLYVGQELLWQEQRIVSKFSFHQTHFAKSRPETLGSSFNEQILKDYNGQTYWLSFNLYSFTKTRAIPKWLNVAVGYGGTGMLYGDEKEAFTNGIVQNQAREFYLSLDIDLTKIETKSHFLKTIFSVFNTIKVPAPTLQIGDFNGVKGHFIYF